MGRLQNCSCATDALKVPDVMTAMKGLRAGLRLRTLVQLVAIT
jgi:hypothetical protein